MAALVTLLEVTAESRGATGADVPKGFALSPGDSVSPLGQKLSLVFADHIGHLEPMVPHLCRPSLAGRGERFQGRRSRGLTVSCTLCCETRKYFAVVLMLR